MTQFADFLAPFDAEKFRREYYGKRPVHIRREGAACPDILNWQRFNDALAIAPYWTEDTLKVVFNSREAPRDNYCDTTDLRPGRAALADPRKVQALVGLGASLVANALHRVSPQVGALAQMLEHTFAAKVVANAYCSFTGVQAFQTHFDLHDVFAFQAEGEKVWQIYEARADAPVQPVPPGDEAEKWLIASRGKVLFEAHMKPGDVLYLPRGQYHDALTQAQASLHVTFGVTPATGLSLFKLLEKSLIADSAFRAYVPDARDGDALKQHLTALAARLQTVMTSPAFATDVLNHQRSLAASDASYALPARQEPSWFSVLRPVQIVHRDNGVALIAGGQELTLGAPYPAVEWMMQQRHFSLEDALARHPGVEESELRSVLDKLIKLGAVAPTKMQR